MKRPTSSGSRTTTKEDSARRNRIAHVLALIEGKSPLEISAYRAQAERLAAGRGLQAATAYSAIEQALWDLAGKVLDVPTHTLFGGKLRDTLPVYANVNRATRPRTPQGFAASAKAAVQEGFRAVKAAPFDGFPPLSSPTATIDAAVENGIACVAAMRDAIGPDVELMVDATDSRLAAGRARGAQAGAPEAGWYEEQVAPERWNRRWDTPPDSAPMAVARFFRPRRFAPLIRTKLPVIMPDVNIVAALELTRIAAMAHAKCRGSHLTIRVGPCRPAAAFSVRVRPTSLLEIQWGE